MDKPKADKAPPHDKEAFTKQIETFMQTWQEGWKECYQNPALMQQMMQSMPTPKDSTPHDSTPHAHAVPPRSDAALDGIWDAVRDLQRRLAATEGRLAALEAAAKHQQG